MTETLFTPTVNGERTINDRLADSIYEEVEPNRLMSDVNKHNSVLNAPIVEHEPQEVPLFVKKRLNGWFLAFWGFTVCRYLFGIGGVLAATIAAVSIDAGVRTYCSVTAAICIAIIGFVKPDDRYRRYIVAWRYLDAKVNLYTYKLISIKELLIAMSEAEQMIDQTERNTITNAINAGS